jgi:hypothetical protein
LPMWHISWSEPTTILRKWLFTGRYWNGKGR